MALTTERSAMMIFQATTALISVLVEGVIHIMMMLGEATLLLGIDLIILLFNNLPIMMFLWVSLLAYQHFWVNRGARKGCTMTHRSERY
ncbi:hypothetical protein OPQ81_006426 [Rhizoctonia solani]|nr:hypothetical protein OPQ81_006426 [Rhizoctonia solani]